jgi:putative ABC transport system permease protein
MLRATLKSLLSRKLRLILSGLAVVLGVMFVSGAFVLTDTLSRSFDSLFATAFSDIDVEVSGAQTVDSEQPATMPASVLDRVKAVPGVSSATGLIDTDGARLIGSDGKVVTTYGAPRLGTNWRGTSDLVMLRQGRGPESDGEIAVNAGLARNAGVHVGDRVAVLTPQRPKTMYTLVGIFEYSGGRDSLGGETSVAFTTPEAQRVMLGQPGAYTAIDVKAPDGVSPVSLRDQVAAALGQGYRVRTGEQAAEAATEDIQSELSFFNQILLGFAGVALFVGTFLILNTFSIIVAQRTRELALMRALGGSRRQVIGSVLVEALIIGTLAAIVGLGLGIGVGAALATLFSGYADGLQLAGIGVPLGAVIGAFAVGIGITVIAALLPALRASRIPPVAALTEVATPDRPLTRLGIAGGATTAIGAALLGWGLTGNAHDDTVWFVLSGVLVSFIGVALLTPLIARPVVSAVGALFSWSLPGKLGRINSGRNPRRTAITAAALMVGLALITGVNVILDSATASLHQMADTQVKADLIISGQQNDDRPPPTFDPAVLDKARKLPGVREVSGDYVDLALINGKQTNINAIADLPALIDMFGLRATEGTLNALGHDQLTLDTDRAKSLGLHVGSAVTVQLSRGGPRTMTVAGIYAKNDAFNGWLTGTDVITDFRVPQPAWGFVRVTDSASLASVKASVAQLLADSPEVDVADRGGYIDQQTKGFNSILTMIQILLALAILIAVLGIVNTLALSVLERTRELGLLRAIGLRREQAMCMVTAEAVVISLFGALLGLAVGSAMGAAVVRALRDEGFNSLALPWGQMAVYLVLAAVAGVLAAVLPAIRAARINVLGAIAYE